MNDNKKFKIQILTLLGFTIFFNRIFILNTTGIKWGPIDPSIWGQYGDILGGFVGSLIAFIGVFLLFETLTEQRKSFVKQQVETRFFELLKLHRDNLLEMNSKSKQGRAVFIEIKDEFHEIYLDLIKIYTLEKSQTTKPIWEKNAIAISYLITFFGVNNSSTSYLKQLIKEIVSNVIVYNNIENLFLNKIMSNHENQKKQNESKNRGYKSFLKFDGHQSRLGHYYRHLYQTVSYINNQPGKLFTYDEKYKYIKTLRAQLSTHEQAVFLYNLISPIGGAWELGPDVSKENLKLITKYNLIKNLPLGFTREVNPKDYFPNVFYEFDKKSTTERVRLKEVYEKE